jgi:hypothetical protein
MPEAAAWQNRCKPAFCMAQALQAGIAAAAGMQLQET